MSVRARPSPSAKQDDGHQSTPETTPGNGTDTGAASKRPPPSRSLSQRAISQTLATTANLANLLPSGTLLAFQLLIPIFTSNGSCDSATQLMTFLLLLALALSCFLASLTDSYRSPQGRVYYGLITFKGMWLFDYNDDESGGRKKPDLRKYRMRFTDWVHAILSVLVFIGVALGDRNVVSCFYPAPGRETQEVLNILPVGIGIICSSLFVVFPTTRQGIGFPTTSSLSSSGHNRKNAENDVVGELRTQGADDLKSPKTTRSGRRY